MTTATIQRNVHVRRPATGGIDVVCKLCSNRAFTNVATSAEVGKAVARHFYYEHKGPVPA